MICGKPGQYEGKEKIMDPISDKIDLSQVRTYPIAERKHKVNISQFATSSQVDISIINWIETWPQILAVNDLKEIVGAIVRARKNNGVVALAMGAHVIKCGLSPLIIKLMKYGLVTSIALNGAGSIHDFEVAMIGETSEDVQSGLDNKRFGIVEETGHHMNEALISNVRTHGIDFQQGMGELLGKKLLDMAPPFIEHSILATGVKTGIPVTVHVSIGCDTIHMHPEANGAAIGQATFNDFRRFTYALRGLGQEGVYLNIGSAVLLPEVFLKALALLHNLGYPTENFTTVNLDMIQHYRPTQNVVHRPTALSGHGYTLIGHHEIMLPLLIKFVIDSWEKNSGLT
jgi:hypothetical protein